MVFVNSMSDLFHPSIPDAYIESVARIMTEANWHTFQVLTKRAERLEALLNSSLAFAAKQRHIWWGVSVENKKNGVPRIAKLQAANARTRFLSIEPLLEDFGTVDLTGIHWAIVGGESGFGARPMKREWVVSLKEQCEQQKVPFFFKQWGGTRKWTAGREIDGRTYDEFPKQELQKIPNVVYRSALLEKLSALASNSSANQLVAIC
jgi:protein gp37